MANNQSCELVIVLDNLNDEGVVESHNRFFITGKDVLIHTILELAPAPIKRTICNLNTANMIVAYGKNPDEEHDFNRISHIKSSEFHVNSTLSPLEFIEFLVRNPKYGYQAEQCVQNRLSEYECELFGY